MALYSAVNFFTSFDNAFMKAIRLIGKNTLFIYLYHLPLVSRILPMNWAVINLLRPWVVLLIFYVAIWVVKKLFQKPKMKSLTGILIGIK